MPRVSKLAAWQPSAAQRAARDAVARAFGLEPHALVSQTRRKPVVIARQAAAWVLIQCWPKLSHPQVGKMLGGRDHSTIIYACRQTEYRRERDAEFCALTDALAAREPEVLAALPENLTARFMRQAERAEREVNPRTRHRRFMAEVLAEPEPNVSRLKLGMRGEPGCPGLSVDEIERRRAANSAARRAHELGQLTAEQHRYRLARRGLALSEMAL